LKEKKEMQQYVWQTLHSVPRGLNIYTQPHQLTQNIESQTERKQRDKKKKEEEMPDIGQEEMQT